METCHPSHHLVNISQTVLFIIQGIMCFNSLAITCRPFEPIANGKIEVTGLTYDSVAHFNCDPGYYITGSAMRSCDTDGEWNGIEGVCKRKHQ